MRIDRDLTVGFFHPLRKTLLRPRGLRIPILMYHAISDVPAEATREYYRTNTSPRVFAEHMSILHKRSYSVVSLSSAVDLISRRSKPVTLNLAVLTFDDGFADFNTAAFPILQTYGFCATVFLPTGYIAEGERKSFKGKGCLHWGEVRDLAAAGVQFGSHTVTHPKLRNLRWDQVEHELRHSKEILEDKLGTVVESFSYPYAFPEELPQFKTRLRTCLVELGYGSGVTTSVGTATEGDDPLFLKRIPVNSDDDLALFLAKLEGGYDWVGYPQYGLKTLRKLLGRRGAGQVT